MRALACACAQVREPAETDEEAEARLVSRREHNAVLQAQVSPRRDPGRDPGRDLARDLARDRPGRLAKRARRQAAGPGVPQP